MQSIRNFSDLPLKKELLDNLNSLGFEAPTPIQKEALPYILAGKDVIGQAKTGSGKTGAFGLGVLSQIQTKLFRPQAMIICPTRELASQVTEELRKLSRQIKNLKILTLCGGVSEYFQKRSLLHGVHIIVGTPGRIEKHLKEKSLKLGNLKWLILDEADRMLEMGFYDDIQRIKNYCPKERQTLLFSATFPPPVLEISKSFQREPVKVKVESTHNLETIEEIFFPLENHSSKLNGISLILNSYRPDRAIIFCKTKVICDQLTKQLRKLGHSVKSIHGDLEQRERTLALTQFSNESISFLIATDVAARGLDIKNLPLVINYDLPLDPEVYTHRIGRTGRAGLKGIAVSLFIPSEIELLKNIELYLKRPNQLKKIDDLDAQLVPLPGPKMKTFFLSAGRKHKLRPGDLLGALTGEANIPGSAVGEIKIFDIFCYFAVERKYSSQTFDRLNKGKIKGRRMRVDKV